MHDTTWEVSCIQCSDLAIGFSEQWSLQRNIFGQGRRDSWKIFERAGMVEL